MKEGILGLVSSTGFIAVNKNLIKLFGTDAAILIGHFASLQNLHKGWFYNTADQIEDATGIKIFSIRKAVKTLKEASVLQVDKRGIPAKLYYLLDEEKLIEIFFTQELRKLKTVSKKTKNCSLENSKHINNKEKNKEKEYIKLHSLDKSPKRLKRTKKKSTNIEESKQSNPTKKELNDQYLPQATKLKDIVQAQKNIKINGQKLNNWCNSIRLLVTSEGVSTKRINKALRWYKENAGGDYVPVIESGQSLREKFTKLENAIERSNKPLNGNNSKTTNNWGTLAYSDASIDFDVQQLKDQDGNIIREEIPYDER